MIRLFIQFYSGIVLALLAAGFFIICLVNTPANQIERSKLNSQLFYVAQTVVNRLQNTEETEWNSVVERCMEIFDDVALVWRPLDDPQLTEYQRKHLQGGKPLYLHSEENISQVLIRLPNTETVIEVNQRDPLENLYSEEILIAGGGVLAIIGAVGFLMIFNIVTRLKALQSVSQQLGKGHWSTRADDAKADTISELARSFNKMAEHIENLIAEKNAMLQEQRELFQAVAHEFRGPMSKLNFAMHLVSDADYHKPSNSLREDIDQSVDDLNSLLSEVLRYSRLQPGTPLLKVKQVTISEIIEPIIFQQLNLFGELRLYVTQLSDRQLQANVDPYYFHRAVLNLLRNACGHARHEVRVSWITSCDSFIVNIEDDGEGIPDKQRKHIFKPFIQIDSIHSKKTAGMGLGLAIVERISLKHQGSVSVDDSSLGGARFQLHWPLNFTEHC